MTQMIGYPCPDCEGTGLSDTDGYRHKCAECGGTAVMWQTKPPRSWPEQPPEPVDEPPEVAQYPVVGDCGCPFHCHAQGRSWCPNCAERHAHIVMD